MSWHKFYTKCDRCGSRGAEYERHIQTCSECGDEVCRECANEYDDDPPGSALCNECAKEKAA